MIEVEHRHNGTEHGWIWVYSVKKRAELRDWLVYSHFGS